MEMDETSVVDTQTVINENTKRELINISKDLEERGYEPVKQIVAYLVSGDPGYISSYKESRNKISKLERTKIIEVLVRNLFK